MEEIIEEYEGITVYTFTCACSRIIITATTEGKCRICERKYRITFPSWPSDVEPTIYVEVKEGDK